MAGIEVAKGEHVKATPQKELNSSLSDLLAELPVKPQRQDSVSEQLADLRMVANRLGMYDAADAIKQWCEHLPELRYGCYCDIGECEDPDGCVLDTRGYLVDDCYYAREGMRKEQCEYWKVVG
jgi:hypothetical protein